MRHRPQSAGLASLALLFPALALTQKPAPPPTPAAPPASVTSTTTTTAEKDGTRVRTVVNRWFDYAYASDVDQGEVLLVQEVRNVTRTDREGSDGHVLVTAWTRAAHDGPFTRRLWSLDVPGNAVRIRDEYGDPYVEVSHRGCCGAVDTHTWYTLATGHKVMDFTGEPVRALAEKAWRFISYVSASGATPVPEWDRDHTVIGILQLSDGQSVLGRAVVHSTGKESGEGTPELLLVSDSARRGTRELWIGSPGGVTGPKAVGGFAVYMNLEGGPVAVRVKDDAFVVDPALVPRGFRVDVVRGR